MDKKKEAAERIRRLEESWHEAAIRGAKKDEQGKEKKVPAVSDALVTPPAAGS